MPMYLQQILNEVQHKKGKYLVYLPGLWLGHIAAQKTKIDYASILANCLEEILNQRRNYATDSKKGWTKRAVVYNIFVRLFTAYDHNQDGVIGGNPADITLNNQGLRETGTFLKTILLLPYLKSLGINTIHLIPITQIGFEGKKGDLGSPYAIKNPFNLDPMLADPVVDIPIEIQYQGVVEAAHFLGMKVVQEFIFRTTAIDSDWTTEHPDWFYWIKDKKKYGAPKFIARQLEKILLVPKGKGEYIPPNKSYRDLFSIPPKNSHQHQLVIASAFADWPPNDVQPPWSDVTYLRLYNYDYKEENNYNYIAYNTIRYYDPELAKKENINKKLWNKISDIIPYYQKTFSIDGAMIDMGHALPSLLKSEIINKAREINPSFAFWDENFNNKPETKKDGYDAVIGDTWYRITKRNGFKSVIASAFDKHPLPYFGAAETHNSPRYGKRNVNKKKSAWLLFNLLPNAIPFLHNGFELNEELPVNTGLNFTRREIDFYSRQPLPLFYKNALNWDLKSNSVTFFKTINEIKQKYPWIFDSKNVDILNTSNGKVLGFIKKYQTNIAIVLFNTNFHKKEVYFFTENPPNQRFFDLIKKKEVVFMPDNIIERGRIILAVSI